MNRFKLDIAWRKQDIAIPDTQGMRSTNPEDNRQTVEIQEWDTTGGMLTNRV